MNTAFGNQPPVLDRDRDEGIGRDRWEIDNHGKPESSSDAEYPKKPKRDFQPATTSTLVGCAFFAREISELPPSRSSGNYRDAGRCSRVIDEVKFIGQYRDNSRRVCGAAA